MDDFVEECGVFGRLVGHGTFLSERMADDLVALLALDLMTQAVKAGLTQAAQVAMRHVLLVWMQQRRAGAPGPMFVVVRPDDLAMVIDTGTDEIAAALREISDHLPMTQQQGWDGRVTFNLSPWIPLKDSPLGTELNRLWLLDHITAVQAHCQEAKHFLDQLLNAQSTPVADHPGAVARMVELRSRRAAWEARQKLTRDGAIEEAMADLWEFHDEVCELENLYDCVVGCLADADGYAEPFGLIWKEQGRAKLQALSLPSPTYSLPSAAALDVSLGQSSGPILPAS